MRPWQILVFFISVVLSLLIIAIIFPENGYKLGNNLKLKFFQVDDIFKSDTNYYADISSIIKNSEPIDNEEEVTDSISQGIHKQEFIPIDTIRADPDSLKKITHLIEFSSTGKKKFQLFFQKLHHLQEKKETVRILHYGDSQIETDRISGPIRNRLQKRFGGSGCGLVPPIPLYKGKMSVYQEYSKQWKRYTGFGKIDSTRGHTSFGALLSYAAYDTSKINSKDLPWFEIKPSPIAYSRARRFNHISLFLSKKNHEHLSMKVMINDSMIDNIETDEYLNYNRLSWNLQKTPQSFSIHFNGKGSPELYGVSLDNNWGIALDNIPLRGSAGLVFSKNDTIQLRQMLDDLNVGMFILQFGGNVVPYMKNAKLYERFFKRELSVLQTLSPDAAILVIGPSDMSIKENGQYLTYPNLENIRDALKKASLDSGCAFWDMYEAMGGRNSMPSWVFAEPPLAISDFVHFNAKGSKIISDMLFNALIYEYNKWEEGH